MGHKSWSTQAKAWRQCKSISLHSALLLICSRMHVHLRSGKHRRISAHRIAGLRDDMETEDVARGEGVKNAGWLMGLFNGTASCTAPPICSWPAHSMSLIRGWPECHSKICPDAQNSDEGKGGAGQSQGQQHLLVKLLYSDVACKLRHGLALAACW